MSLPVQIDNNAKGLDRLLYQFNDKELIKAFLSSYLKQIDKTQTDTVTLLDNRSIYNATNSFLDDIGKILRVSRAGDTDDTYRDRLLDQILVDTSEGTPSDVLTALKEVTNATTVRMFEHYPCNLHLYTNGTSNLDTVANTISKTVPATVSDVTIIVDDIGGVFTPSELTTVVSGIGNLVTNTGDTIVDDNGNQIVVTTLEYISDTSLAILPELTTTNSVTGNLITNTGDTIVDNNGNQITVTAIQEGTYFCVSTVEGEEDVFQVDTGSGLEDFLVSNIAAEGGIPMAEIRRIN